MWSYASEFDWQKRFGAFWWSSPSCLCFWNRATSLHSQEWHTHGGELSGLFFVLHSLKGTDSCWWFMCTQSTKDVLERMVHSSDFHALCPPGAKTSPLGLEPPRPSAQASPPTVCPRRVARESVDIPCTVFGRSKKDSLHSINPAFRLASPSPSLTRANLILSDAHEDGFLPPKQFQKHVPFWH